MWPGSCSREEPVAIPDVCGTCCGCKPLCRTCSAGLRTCSLRTLPDVLWFDSGRRGAAIEQAGGVGPFPRAGPAPSVPTARAATCSVGAIGSVWQLLSALGGRSLCCGLKAPTADAGNDSSVAVSTILQERLQTWLVTHPQLVPALERPEGDGQTTTSPSSFAVPLRAQDSFEPRLRNPMITDLKKKPQKLESFNRPVAAHPVL